MEHKKHSKFKISQDNCKIVKYKCFHCGQTFGVSYLFLDITGEVDFIFCCPYCKSNGRIV